MALKKFKPITPSLRFTVLPAFDEITKDRPERSLLKTQKSKAGRNCAGRVTIRHRGGGHKQQYRIIDFKRAKRDIPAKVAAIEYDPNRTARIALLHYADGVKTYILAPKDLVVGTKLMAGDNVEPIVGNALPLAKNPLGLMVRNIEMEPGSGAKLVRGAGAGAMLMAREGGYAQLKLPSGEMRQVLDRCYATVGQVGHLDHNSGSLGKAGRKRWLGWRPTVRGVAMNPVDHPMGGGEGRTSGGGHPVSPWGQLTKGKKTRSKRKASQKLIIKRRK